MIEVDFAINILSLEKISRKNILVNLEPKNSTVTQRTTFQRIPIVSVHRDIIFLGQIKMSKKKWNCYKLGPNWKNQDVMETRRWWGLTVWLPDFHMFIFKPANELSVTVFDTVCAEFFSKENLCMYFKPQVLHFSPNVGLIPKRISPVCRALQKWHFLLSNFNNSMYLALGP